MPPARDAEVSSAAWCALGLSEVRAGRYEQAADAFREALRADGSRADLHTNLGGALFRLGHFEEAAAAFRQAIALKPDIAGAEDNLGAALQVLGRFDEAIACLRNALARDPDNCAALCNLGNALRGQGAFDEALDCYGQALKRRPGLAHAEWNRALVYLMRGDLKRGWAAYSWRCGAGVASFPKIDVPLWDGAALDHGRLLVLGEQGVGDEIMFASCLPEVIARTGRCVLVCEPRLAPLFRRAFDGLEVRGTRRGTDHDLDGIGPLECWIPAGDLPRHLRSKVEHFPRTAGYLRADPKKTASWEKRLAALGHGPKVGLSWRGGRAGTERFRRSTSLELWARLSRIPELRFVNLQYGDCREEIAEARRRWGLVIADWTDADPLADLDDFAAEIAALDLVISVDNATVHMAGALGKPVWTLLPKPADWRWMTERADSLWYPSMRLFRQAEPHRWEPVFAELARGLESLAARAAGGSIARPGGVLRDSKFQEKAPVPGGGTGAPS